MDLRTRQAAHTEQIGDRTGLAVRQQERVHALLEAGAVAHQVQTPTRTLALSAHHRVGQPDRRHQIATSELGKHPSVDPVGLARQQCQALHLLRIRDLDLPARQLKSIVHEPRAVHRLERRADRLAMPIESSRQAEQTVGIRRRRTNLNGRSLTVKQMEVETLAAEIQTGVQHRNGPPLDSSQSTSWSVSLGRPFFMAFLTMRSETVAVGCHRLPIGLFGPFSVLPYLRPVATGCARLAPQTLVASRSLAVCWSMACGPLPVSSRTDGS